MHVGFDGAFTDKKLVGNILISQAIGHLLKNLKLSFGKWLCQLFSMRLLLCAECLSDDFSGCDCAENRFASEGSPNGVYQFFRKRVLQQVTDCACSFPGFTVLSRYIDKIISINTIKKYGLIAISSNPFCHKYNDSRKRKRQPAD